MPKLNYKKIIAFLIFILVLKSALAQDSEVVNSLNKVIHQITTINPDSGFADINFLKDRLKNKEIVALGEVTHGTKEVFIYKDRLVRYLVSQLGYKTIAFEADYNALEMIDRYINGKIDTAIMSPVYQSLFEWLRSYNQSIGEEDKVHIYGLEIRQFNAAIDNILLSAHGLIESDRQVLIKIRKTQFDKIDKASLAEFRLVTTRLPESLHSRMLIQLIDNYYPFIGKKENKIGSRDHFMAENAVALKEHTKGKMVIWAHNGHVAKTSLFGKPTMGSYLAKKFGDTYFAVATDFNKGYVKVREFVAKNKPVSDWLPKYYPDVASNKGYEYYFKQCKFKTFILDLQSGIADDQLGSFLKQAREMRLIGGLSVPVNKKLSIADNFDLLVYFDETNSL